MQGEGQEQARDEYEGPANPGVLNLFGPFCDAHSSEDHQRRDHKKQVSDAVVEGAMRKNYIPNRKSGTEGDQGMVESPGFEPKQGSGGQSPEGNFGQGKQEPQRGIVLGDGVGYDIVTLKKTVVGFRKLGKGVQGLERTVDGVDLSKGPEEEHGAIGDGKDRQALSEEATRKLKIWF